MEYTEEDKYEGRVFGFSLTLATMYLKTAQKKAVYDVYDDGLRTGMTVEEATQNALHLADEYDSFCQSCNGRIDEGVTALCGTCLLHYGGIKEFYETRPDDYDISNSDLPWVWTH